MALTFKKPPPPAPPPDQVRTLCFPGEARKAVLSGKRFGLYNHKTKREMQYRVDSIKNVMGFSGDGEIKLGYLAEVEDGALAFDKTRIDNPDWSSLTLIFNRNWNLLEAGCRLHPDTEWRLYE